MNYFKRVIQRDTLGNSFSQMRQNTWLEPTVTVREGDFVSGIMLQVLEICPKIWLHRYVSQQKTLKRPAKKVCTFDSKRDCRQKLRALQINFVADTKVTRPIWKYVSDSHAYTVQYGYVFLSEQQNGKPHQYGTVLALTTIHSLNMIPHFVEARPWCRRNRY